MKANTLTFNAQLLIDGNVIADEPLKATFDYDQEDLDKMVSGISIRRDLPYILISEIACEMAVAIHYKFASALPEKIEGDIVYKINMNGGTFIEFKLSQDDNYKNRGFFIYIMNQMLQTVLCGYPNTTLRSEITEDFLKIVDTNITAD